MLDLPQSKFNGRFLPGVNWKVGAWRRAPWPGCQSTAVFIFIRIRPSFFFEFSSLGLRVSRGLSQSTLGESIGYTSRTSLRSIFFTICLFRTLCPAGHVMTMKATTTTTQRQRHVPSPLLRPPPAAGGGGGGGVAWPAVVPSVT